MAKPLNGACPCCARAASSRLRVTSDARALDGLSLLYIAGLDADEAAALARRARSAGVLVNVEDVPELCDFPCPRHSSPGRLDPHGLDRRPRARAWRDG